MWYELTKQQQKQKNWRSVINNILHRNAGWTHAAKSVMQYGLPKLAKPRNPDDAFERIGALVLLAKDIAHWLKKCTQHVRVQGNRVIQEELSIINASTKEKTKKC